MLKGTGGGIGLASCVEVMKLETVRDSRLGVALEDRQDFGNALYERLQLHERVQLHERLRFQLHERSRFQLYELHEWSRFQLHEQLQLHSARSRVKVLRWALLQEAVRAVVRARCWTQL
jgi:hypothetical protein